MKTGLHGLARQLENNVLDWAKTIFFLLPKQLPVTRVEANILKLYIAQQKRLNIEIDGNRSWLGSLGMGCLLFARARHWRSTEEHSAAHKQVQQFLNAKIEEEIAQFCREKGLSPNHWAVEDWRIAIRYMGQQLHRLATTLHLARYRQLPPHQRQELHRLMHELACYVEEKREQMLAIVFPFNKAQDLHASLPAN